MEYPDNTYYSSNNNGLLNNTQFLASLYNGVVANLKRPLSNSEKKWLQSLLRQEIPGKYRNRQPKEILEFYTKFVTDKLKNNSCTYERIDTHELNKSRIGLASEIAVSDFGHAATQNFTADVTSTLAGPVSISNFLGINDLNSILSKLNPSSVVKTESIMLDTRYRSLDNDGTLYFKWNAVYDNSDIQGAFNINQRVRDVVAMKCFPIKMPYVHTADNDYGRVTLLFQEFQSQSFVAHENTKFHYIFATDVQERWIHLRSHNYNDGIFRFATPLTQLSSLTVSLASPLQPIVFDADRMSMTVSDYVTNQKIYFTSTATHNLETGDVVYITNFTTRNSSADAVIIGQVNTQYGNKCTYVNDYTIYLDINATTIYQQEAGTIAVTNNSNSVIGTGTSFISVFTIGDYISVNGVFLVVQSILSNTSIITTAPYPGVTGSYIYYRDNRVPGLQVPIYFGSKRMFMEFEISYLDSGVNHV